MFKALNVIFLFFVFNIFALSQTLPEFDPSADAAFNEGIVKFENGNFTEARSIFNKCIYDYNNHHRTSAAYIMLAKSEYNLKKYKDALVTINDFLEYFPNSSYLREAYYVTGLSYYKLNKIDTALFYLLKSYDKTENEYAEARVIRPIKYLYNKKAHIDLPGPENYSTEKTRELLKTIVKEKNDNSPESDNNYSESDLKNDMVKQKEFLREEDNSITKTGSVEYRIGVFTIPNSGTGKKGHEDLESDFIEALKFGVNEFNSNSNIKISLKIINSKQDSTSLISEIESLNQDKGLLAIVGPVYSEQFSIAASFASKKGIPIISPTATGNGIASLGEYVFQANPDFVNRARSMAIYAVKKMRLKNIAVFAPKNVYGKMMSESFSREISKRGGNIITTEFYDSDAKKMQKSMLNLVNSIYSKGGELFLTLSGADGNENIQKMIKAGISKRLIDSLKLNYHDVNICSIFGRDAKSKTEKLKMKTNVKTTYEVDQPVYSVDAIYIPINSKNDIKNISAALLSYKIYAKVLGTGDYNHLLELEANRKNMDGLVFDSDAFFDVSIKGSLNFSKSFSEKTGRKVTQYSLFGYDVLGLVLQAIKKGNTSRQSIKTYLCNLDSFQGLHSKISLKSNRINSYLNILEYKNKKISKIDEINVSKE